MSRLEKLLWLAELTETSIQEAPVDKRSPLIAQLRGILSEVDELDPNVGGSEERNGLIDFQAALAERQQPAPAGTRRSAGG